MGFTNFRYTIKPSVFIYISHCNGFLFVCTFLNLIDKIRNSLYLSLLTFLGIPLFCVIFIIITILTDSLLYNNTVTVFRNLLTFSIIYLFFTTLEFLIFRKRINKFRTEWIKTKVLASAGLISNKIKDHKNIVPLLEAFADDFLKVNYMFWLNQEPYFTTDVIPCFSP